ncbi:hypothetical protein B0H16DRAFT_1452104 [Mycena metata]|uniref:Uncharacterized protein n=1 Tax=Mycena metata TaxID=1033252 RepID=A0AAD7JUB8_9AGAR|nr:hypothetical protein B0H16DRAFT_1452104 [Mycena metata]
MQRAMDAFRSDEPLYNIPEVIGSPRLVLQLFAALNSIALTTSPQGRDIQLLPDGTWQLRPDFVTSIWHGCGHLATFIICAAHGFDMANYTGDLPFNLPLACIRQISLPAPSILLCLAYPQNPWIGRTFTTQAGALLEGNEYCTFTRCGMAWISVAATLTWHPPSRLDGVDLSRVKSSYLVTSVRLPGQCESTWSHLSDLSRGFFR